LVASAECGTRSAKDFGDPSSSQPSLGASAEGTRPGQDFGGPSGFQSNLGASAECGTCSVQDFGDPSGSQPSLGASAEGTRLGQNFEGPSGSQPILGVSANCGTRPVQDFGDPSGSQLSLGANRPERLQSAQSSVHIEATVVNEEMKDIVVGVVVAMYGGCHRIHNKKAVLQRLGRLILLVRMILEVSTSCAFVSLFMLQYLDTWPID